MSVHSDPSLSSAAQDAAPAAAEALTPLAMETTGASGSTLPAELGLKSSRLATIRHLLVIPLSAAWPGVGHFLLGQVGTGMVLSALFAGLLCCFWPLRLLRYYAGFVTVFMGWIALALYSSCGAQLITNVKTGTRLSKCWLLFTIPVALVVVSLVGAGATRASGFRSFAVPSTSMEPTIQRGDRIVVDTRAFKRLPPQYRDVIVCFRDRTFFIKRIIAIDGDSIEGRSGNIFVNGTLMNESYIEHSRAASTVGLDLVGNPWMQTFGPVTVPSGKYFVLGDNRDVSLDSRSPEFGLLDRSSITGKVLYIYSTRREGARVR